MMLHRHFEGDTPKTVTKLADVTPKAPAPVTGPGEKAATEVKKPGRPKNK